MRNATEVHQRLLIGHGAAVMLLGMVAGFAYAFSLLGEVSLSPIPYALAERFPGRTEGWRAAHLGNILNGVMIVALASALPRLRLPSRRETLVTRALVVTVWGNACFYVFATFAPNHGLSLGDNRLGSGNLAGALAYLPAMVAAVAVTLALAVIVGQALRPASGAESRAGD